MKHLLLCIAIAPFLSPMTCEAATVTTTIDFSSGRYADHPIYGENNTYTEQGFTFTSPSSAAPGFLSALHQPHRSLSWDDSDLHDRNQCITMVGNGKIFSVTSFRLGGTTRQRGQTLRVQGFGAGGNLIQTRTINLPYNPDEGDSHDEFSLGTIVLHGFTDIVKLKFDASGDHRTSSSDSTSITLTDLRLSHRPVPEPTTFALLTLAGAGLLHRKRRLCRRN